MEIDTNQKWPRLTRSSGPPAQALAVPERAGRSFQDVLGWAASGSILHAPIEVDHSVASGSKQFSSASYGYAVQTGK